MSGQREAVGTVLMDHMAVLTWIIGGGRRRQVGRCVLLLGLLVCVVGSGSVALWAQSPPAGTATNDLFVVRLRRPSLVEHLLATVPRKSNLRFQARTRSAEAYRSQLRAEHQDLIARISADRRLRVIGDCSYLINVVFVRGERDAADNLRSDPDVQGVYPSVPRYPMLDTAVGVIRAPDLWGELGGVENAGRDVKIAIIDSGIFQDHAMFRGDGLTPPEGFPKVDREEDLPYTNGKVIVARSFCQWFPDPSAPEGCLPIDEQGHGSRVAAIAAGRVTDAPIGTIEGFAPMAFLGNYKIFGSGVNRTTTSAAVIAAIDQAVEDQMDVINLSLGGTALDPGTAPEEAAIANAVAAGVVVVAAAGNLGPGAESVTAPGTSADAITVGAVSNARKFGPGVEFGPSAEVPNPLRVVAYIPGDGVSIPDTVGPLPLSTVEEWDPTGEACASTAIPPGALAGSIVLVRRGTCKFQEKADHVFAAGASALVVYNNVGGGAMLMGFDTVLEAPAVAIDRDSGEALRDLLRSDPATPITAAVQAASESSPLPVEGDVLAAFSGRGPTIGGSLKPDLVAIGTDIYTASNHQAGATDYFSQGSSGTSFATPMVSGAAALLRQLHPDWPVGAIKSALVSTAVKTPRVDDRPAHLVQMGNGRLDLGHIAEIDSSLDRVSISFGFINGSIDRETRTLTLTNLGSVAHQYSLLFEPWLDTPSGAVSLSSTSISLNAGLSGQVEIELDTSVLPNGGTVEGFVVISESTTGMTMTVPVWGVIVREDPKTTLRVSKASSDDFQTLSTALQAAKPGNTIEIADSATYTFAGTIRMNAQGVPLNGIRIRSRTGETPAIDGSLVSLSSPVMTVAGLQRVTLEGLHLIGGSHGVEFNQASGLIKDCTIETNSPTSLGYGIRLDGGSRVQIYGNRIGGAAGSAISIQDSEAVVENNRIGDEADGLSIGGIGVDLGTTPATALFDNSIFGGTTSRNQPGIRLTWSSALLKGNRVQGFHGDTGDGIRAAGSLSFLEATGNLLSDNGRAGLLLQSATADVSRNHFLTNGSAGLHLESDSRLTGRAETLLENQRGIVSVGSTLSLSNSLIAFSGDAGVLATTSALQLLNDTVFGNSGAGVSAVAADSTLLANSIVFGNAAGEDLVGIDPSESTPNLTGDQTPAPGTPGPLSDPEGGDFSLADGSEAIDAGDNGYAADIESDLAGHRRIVDGDGDGIARVDIGALEYGSPFAPPLVLPLSQPSSDEFIGLALTNAHSLAGEAKPGAATIELAIRGDNGSIQSLADPPAKLDAMSQRAQLVTEWVEHPANGWLEILADRSDVVGFMLVGDKQLSRLDGVALGDPPSSVQVLTEVRTTGTSSTRFFVVNPGASQASVEIRSISAMGAPGSALAGTIAPGGRWVVDASQLPGVQDDGYIRVDSTDEAPLSVVEFFGTDATLGALPGRSARGSSSTLFGAQLAVTSGIGSRIRLINLGELDDVTLEAYRESGELAASRTLSLGPGQQWHGDAGAFFGLDELVGWLRVTSNRAELVGSVTYADPDNRLLAALPLESSGARESVFSHVAQTDVVFTGLTLLNPGSEPALVSIEVFDAAGHLLGAAFPQLEPGEKRARVLPEWIPGLAFQSEGFVRIRANRPVIGFELFGSAEYLAAVPQQVIQP